MGRHLPSYFYHQLFFPNDIGLLLDNVTYILHNYIPSLSTLHHFTANIFACVKTEYPVDTVCYVDPPRIGGEKKHALFLLRKSNLVHIVQVDLIYLLSHTMYIRFVLNLSPGAQLCRLVCPSRNIYKNICTPNILVQVLYIADI